MEPFFASVGDSSDRRSLISKDTIEKNQVGTRAKLSHYDANLSTLDTYYLKFALYLISFILRILSKIVVKRL